MVSQLLYPFTNSFWREGLFILTPSVNSIHITSEDYFKHKNKELSNYLSKNQSFVKKNNSMLFFVLINQGFLFYFVMLAFIYFIYKRLYKYNLILLIPLGYTATIFLGPVIYFRYTYFLTALVPMVIMMLTNKNNNILLNKTEK